VFAEPGIDLDALDGAWRVVRFGALNLFFGGVQAALREGRQISGAGDPRRGGVAVSA
jgi:gamma-glutamyltranspeptidase